MTMTSPMLAEPSSLAPAMSSVINSYPFEPWSTPEYVKVIDCIILGLVSLAGVVGNFLIFAAVLTDKRLLNQSNALVLNIAAADLLIVSFVLPVVIGNVIENRSILDDNGCVFASCIVVITAGVSIESMAAISANRYIFICRHHDYDKYFSKRNTAILIVSMWTFWSILMGVTALWQPHYYNPDSVICIFDHQNSLLFTGFLMGFGIGLPAVVTFVCYYKVWRKIVKSQKAMTQHRQQVSTLTDNQNEKKLKRKRLENRATASLFVAFMCFLVFWGPYGIAAVVYYFQRLPQYTIKYLSWLGMANSCVNSIVYGAMNKNYRDGYVKILTCGRQRIRPDNNGNMSMKSDVNSVVANGHGLVPKIRESPVSETASPETEA